MIVPSNSSARARPPSHPLTSQHASPRKRRDHLQIQRHSSHTSRDSKTLPHVAHWHIGTLWPVLWITVPIHSLSSPHCHSKCQPSCYLGIHIQRHFPTSEKAESPGAVYSHNATHSHGLLLGVYWPSPPLDFHANGKWHVGSSRTGQTQRFHRSSRQHVASPPSLQEFASAGNKTRALQAYRFAPCDTMYIVNPSFSQSRRRKETYHHPDTP